MNNKLKPLRPSDDPAWRAPTLDEIKAAFEEGARLAEDMRRRMDKMTIVHPSQSWLHVR